MNGTKLSADCVNGSSVNMFRKKVDTYLRRADCIQIKKMFNLSKPMASLSTCHLGLCLGWQSCSILLNLVISIRKGN